ncbi:MAG: glutamine amidotransferase [Planctomycetes bacterium]|nr:glutamine amidotransferase [Planctomycetota bacterium]
MTELRFQPVVSLPLVLVIAAVLIALLWVRPRHVQLGIGKWAVLIGLRLLVVLLALFAMLRPTFVYTKVEPVKASLVLLMDGSRSMQVADSLGDKPRWDAMRMLLDAAAGDLAKLGARWDVSAYAFDTDARKLEVRDGKVTLPAAAEGEQSALGAAMADTLDRESGGRVLGVLLLSDGAQRAVAPHDLPPQLAVRRLAAENIPLYTFTFGKSGGSERADLAIDDLVTNETVFAETPVEVRGRLSAEGYANQRVKVQLLWETADGSHSATRRGEMKVVDATQVDTGVEGGSVPVALHHTPTSAGEYKVTLRVEPHEGELVTTNNEVSTFVTVRAGGINVLYLVGTKRVGGGPGQEQRFVRAALAQSPDIVVERRLINYEPPEADLVDAIRDAKPDVIILDDVDARGLNAASWKAMAERVRAGAGLMMLGGYHSFGPGGHRETPLTDVLPVNLGPAQRQGFGEPLREDVHLPGPVRMRPAAPLGTRHPVMRVDVAAGGPPADSPTGRPPVATDAIWEQLPALDGANRIGRSELKPNAQVLAEADDAARHPLLVAGQSGDGRVLAFAGDSTWRWPMGGFGEAHRRFWRQAVLWLAKKDEQTEGRVWIRLAGRRVMRGTRVDFGMGAEDAQGAPIETAQFEVKVTTPDGADEVVRPTRGAVSPRLPTESRRDSATWAATFRETAKPGDYRITVTAKDGANVLGTAEARFLVPDQDLELDRPAAEPSLMAQLAEMTKSAGGAALAPEELPDLLKRLADKPPELKEEVVAKITYWDTWPFFLTLVGLLGVEWFLRKQWGLV